MSETKDEMVVRLWNEGVTIEMMVRDLFLDSREVYNILDRNGVQVAGAPGVPQTHHIYSHLQEMLDDYYGWMDMREFSKKWGISVPIWYAMLSRDGRTARSKTEEHVGGKQLALDRAVEMYKRGEKLRVIKRETGIYGNTLYEALDERGIALRR